MKKEKLLLIGGCVLALLVIGVLSSHFLNWPVDSDETSGDIGKATRFSREMESEGLSNMEELLKSDPEFKDGIVAAQVIMQTRAAQFGSLVDMSNEVAGEIPAFAEVLKDMNDARGMVDNVNNSLAESAQNLDAALGGEECPDLAQNTINASLAYTTLQKQNNLANRFIEATDKYLETAQGDDRLKFVRDQWVDYQKMTAALDGDKDAAEALAKRGNLLSGEKTLAAMADFGIANQVAMVNSAIIIKNTGVDGSLVNALPEGALEGIYTKIRNAAEVYGNQADVMNNQAGVAKFNQQVIDALNEAIIVASQQKIVSSQQTMVNQQAKVGQQAMANQQAKVGQQAMVSQQAKVSNVNPVVFNQTVDMMASANVMKAYTNVMNSAQMVSNQQVSLGVRINDMINQIATLGGRLRKIEQ